MYAGLCSRSSQVHRQLTFTFGQLEKLAFFHTSLQRNRWEPRISWLGTFALLAIFFRHSLVYVIAFEWMYTCKLTTISQYLPLAKHSNVTPDVVPFIATWLVGLRIKLGVEGIELGLRPAK